MVLNHICPWATGQKGLLQGWQVLVSHPCLDRALRASVFQFSLCAFPGLRSRHLATICYIRWCLMVTSGGENHSWWLQQHLVLCSRIRSSYCRCQSEQSPCRCGGHLTLCCSPPGEEITESASSGHQGSRLWQSSAAPSNANLGRTGLGLFLNLVSSCFPNLCL